MDGRFLCCGTGPPERYRKEGVTLKDNDMRQKLFLTSENRELTIETLAEDTARALHRPHVSHTKLKIHVKNETAAWNPPISSTSILG